MGSPGNKCLDGRSLSRPEAWVGRRFPNRCPEALRALKDELGLTGEQMAEVFGLVGGQQWRKYTGDHAPRDMSVQMAFFGAARLSLDAATLQVVTERMRALGAQVEDLPPLP